jgi:hypothetical protein
MSQGPGLPLSVNIGKVPQMCGAPISFSIHFVRRDFSITLLPLLSKNSQEGANPFLDAKSIDLFGLLLYTIKDWDGRDCILDDDPLVGYCNCNGA